MMMWLYYTSILLLIGGEINSQLYEKLERKEELLPEDKTKSRGTVKNVSGAKTSDFNDTEISDAVIAVTSAYHILSCKETAKHSE